MSSAKKIRFRHSQAILVAAGVAVIGALPIGGANWFLTPVLLVPLAVWAWAWRAGTDADPSGLWLRALIGQRHIPWSEVRELAPDARGRAVALLSDGRPVLLPAVRATDLPRLVAASGQTVDQTTAH